VALFFCSSRLSNNKYACVVIEVAYHRKDSWYRKAKDAGYRSRAAYKLLELDRKAQLLRTGMKVVDLGCAPGGWLQVAARKVGKKGRIVGVDLLSVEPLNIAQVEVVLGDIRDRDMIEVILEKLKGKADLVLSDMAPNTSGVSFKDHHGSIELVRMALETAIKVLVVGGTFVAKIFEGPDTNLLVDDIKIRFSKVRRIKPDTTRKGSRELYLVAHSLKGEKEIRR
jgi:23S rRNA (uridine2552-2'-O)-methyltransferase